MRIITFANNKGGVGKTTSALAVAHELHNRGHRVLFIDADPQGNATTALPEVMPQWTLARALAETQRPFRDLMQRVDERLFLIPAGPDLAKYEKNFHADVDYMWFFRDRLAALGMQLAKEDGDAQLKQLAVQLPATTFDYAIIDTGPNLGSLTVAALVASEAVFIPLQPNLFSSEGMGKLLDMVARLRQNFNQRLRVGGIFFTKYARSYRKALHHQYARELQDDPALGRLVMSTTIRENVALDEAQSARAPIYAYAPASNGAADYRELTSELLSRLN